MTHSERLEQRRIIAQLVNEGHTRAEVCRMYGFSITTIDRACLEFGVRGKSMPSIKGFKILKLLVDGVAQHEVCAMLGVCKQHVSHLYIKAKEAGWDI